MRTVPKRIQNAYFQLHKSRLIMKGHLDSDAVLHFETILNSALPVNDYEHHIYYFIKDLYYDDPSKFLNFISNSNLQPLILYTNNKNIINHFNLQYKLYINWDAQNKKYIVQLYKNKLHSINSNSSNSLYCDSINILHSNNNSSNSLHSIQSSVNSISDSNSSFDSNKSYII